MGSAPNAGATQRTQGVKAMSGRVPESHEMYKAEMVLNLKGIAIFAAAFFADIAVSQGDQYITLFLAPLASLTWMAGMFLSFLPKRREKGISNQVNEVPWRKEFWRRTPMFMAVPAFAALFVWGFLLHGWWLLPWAVGFVAFQFSIRMQAEVSVQTIFREGRIITFAAVIVAAMLLI